MKFLTLKLKYPMILESFQHLESGDSEKKIAIQILGKSADVIPEKWQSTLNI